MAVKSPGVPKIAIRFELLPEERIALQAQLSASAKSADLSQAAREVAREASVAMALSSRSLTLKYTPAVLMALVAALEHENHLPVTVSRAVYVTMARIYAAHRIRTELIRRGLAQ